MTTDKTPATLATAKHGGCVQLGDWPSIEERARELLAAEYAMAGSTKRADKIIAGFDCAPGTEYALRAIVAALSAQPSPGGQGDAPEIEQIRTLVSSILSTVSLGHQKGPYAYAGEDFGHYLAEATRDCRAILRALSDLAARQPVGEAVAFRVHYLSGKTGEVIETGKWCDAPVPSFIDESVTLFSGNTQRLELAYSGPPAQQPAQAVDLGGIPEGWRLSKKATCYQLSHGTDIIGNLVGPDAEENAAIIARVLDSQPVGK